jgi:hypothetical protein
MNKLLCFLVLIAGCTAPSVVVEIPIEEDYAPDLAWELGEPTLAPTPDPKPAPSGKCLVCNGTGRIDGDHDGEYDYDCSACGGDGIASVEFSIVQIPQSTTDYIDFRINLVEEEMDELWTEIRKLVSDLPLPEKEEPVPVVLPEIVPDIQGTMTEEYYVNWDGVEYVWDTEAFVALSGKKIVLDQGSPDTDTYITMCKGDMCYRVNINTRNIRT